MRVELTAEQRAARAEFRAFAKEEVAPHADRFDREEAIPTALIGRLAERGDLGSLVSAEHGGLGRDMITYGLLTEELGKACSSVRSLLTVHDMVAHGIERWGSAALRERWLPPLARGRVIGALAVSEPGAGSDASGIETVALAEGDSFLLSGRKKWISFGQIAGLFLVLAKLEDKPTAFLVEREMPGVTVKPLAGITGTRASMLAEIFLDGCRVPKENLIGRPGFGVSAVISTALDHGRYSVAWGAVGLAQGCLDASRAYAAERRQFGRTIGSYQALRHLLADMYVRQSSMWSTVLYAAAALDDDLPDAEPTAAVAKAYVARSAREVAHGALQVFGGIAFTEEHQAHRFLRRIVVREQQFGDAAHHERELGRALAAGAAGRRDADPAPTVAPAPVT